jgi:hypothetical protein
LDLDVDCSSVGLAPPAIDTSCAIDFMLIAPRIQRVGLSIHLSADPSPTSARLTWSASDDSVGTVRKNLSADRGDAADAHIAPTYEFQCEHAGFGQILVDLVDGTCAAHDEVPVVCVADDVVIDSDL